MKLITKNGQLDLPRDFSLTMERTNPLLSGEGDASIPATLPASSNNLKVLDHRERIDRAERYINKVEAVLQVGPIQKRGQLVIDTVHRSEGIDASFAIDNSDLYVQSKDKTLKEIIDMGRNGLGIKIPFSDIDSACQYMINIYNGNMPGADFVVFPVAVAAYEEGEDDNKETVYQYNNEPGGPHGLVYEERIVREGDVNMLVPEGYGIAPFLKLQRMIAVIFQCLGYTVTENCFNEEPFYSQIAIVHNCPDSLLRKGTPELDYADLVPSCTLSEFLEWLLAKFHVQPVVNSESKEVRIMKMDDILNMLVGGYDKDISGMVEGDWKVQLNPSKRIVLTPTIEIEGTEAAAETFDKLLEKYGEYGECTEAQFQSLTGDNPAFYDCLILRKATGRFYLIERELSDGKAQLHELGTNYFVYDRDNSDETEDFSQVDVLPLMLCGPKCETAPYIGKRIHRHTSYGDKEDDGEQKIIAVQAHSLQHFAYRTTGTTQRSIPYANGTTFYNFWFGMDNYSMYPEFWANYNRLLLNYPVHLTGRLKYGIAQFINMDMSALKLCDGQRLLPVRASASIGEKMGITEAEFIRAEHYLDEVSDSQPTPIIASTLKWQLNSESDEQTARMMYATIIAPISMPTMYTGYTVKHDGIDDPVWLGTPKADGETRTITAIAYFTIKYKQQVVITDSQGNVIYGDWEDHVLSWENTYQPNGTNRLIVTKTYNFVAVPV